MTLSDRPLLRMGAAKSSASLQPLPTATGLAMPGIAEFSVYVARAHRGEGVGRVALQGLLQAAEGAGSWKLLSRIFVENTASRGLCREMGFREVGIYERHGQLEGIWRDCVIVERTIDQGTTS
jgi:phosphinothricin acetyltransferase